MAAEIAKGVLAALHYRELERAKGNSTFEFSPDRNIMRLMSWVWPYLQITGKLPQPAGNRDVSNLSGGYLPRSDDDTFLALWLHRRRRNLQDCAWQWADPSWPKMKGSGKHTTRLERGKRHCDPADHCGLGAPCGNRKKLKHLAKKHGFAATHLYTAKDLVEK